MRNYESGNVPPVPPYLRDTLCKCTECGATWIGPLKPLCSECAPTAGDNVLGADNTPPVPESARADMERQLVSDDPASW